MAERSEARYGSLAALKMDATQVGRGKTLPQRQDSLDDQIADLITLAHRFGCYDAADWLAELQGCRDRYARPYAATFPTRIA